MERYLLKAKPSSSREPLAHASPNPGKKSAGRPAKRIKTAERARAHHSDEEDEDEHDDNSPSTKEPPRPTIETALPPVATEEEAIDEYEHFRASQVSQSDHGHDEADAASRLENRQWVRGRSSIYVDAFNLALDTVLEQEAHLFDDRETTVFEQWRALSYEAQYLYVRLFLRKTASWHRVERLGYHGDISDVRLAMASLLDERRLPDGPFDEDHVSLADKFTFADDSETCITTMEEASSLLSLDELKTLAKEAKVQGKNKGELLQAFRRASARQSGLLSVGLQRSGTHDSARSESSGGDDTPEPCQHSNRNAHFLNKILAMTGQLIRLSEPVFKLFERVHLVFYRSTEWTEKSLTTIILAKISRRNFPEYVVCRSANIFGSRGHLVEFEQSMRREFDVDQILEASGPPGEEGFRRVLAVFESIAGRWRDLLREEQRKEDAVYEAGEGGYLRRFNAAHAYTRIAHKAAYVLGRLHSYGAEHALLTELLAQRLFHPARRGAWYQRKALLEEHYMWEVESGQDDANADAEVRRKHWRRVAAATCSAALEDRDCHLVHHHDLQKRLVKLERRLRIPRREQHDFGHVRLRRPEEHTVQGVQLVRGAEATAALTARTGRAASTKTMWLDEGAVVVSVEDMCLSHYRRLGWKGYHAEGGIVRTLFAYLFYDVLFAYVPNVFQTAYQTCPLDLHTDAFYAARASAVEHRLAAIANGAAAGMLRAVHGREQARRPCVVGLNWDFDVDDLAELAACFRGEALASVCKVLAQEYRTRGGGVPDLVLWRTAREAHGDGGEEHGEVMFAEVKTANDRLSDAQRLWMHVLAGAGVRVALCHAVASEERDWDG